MQEILRNAALGFVVVAVASGCAGKLSPAAEQVKIAEDDNVVSSCTKLGNLRGSAGVMAGPKGARDKARELGAKMGGTHLRIRREESEATGATAWADVYKCEGSVPAKDSMLEPAG
jgi:hypothetical protein